MGVNFETIGNATLIVSENNRTILCTDPWFDEDPAYFGSWRLSHKFPKEQRIKCENSKYIFISHFHPDHLNIKSLKKDEINGSEALGGGARVPMASAPLGFPPADAIWRG